MSNSQAITYGDLPQELRSYREAWGDLGAVLDEYGNLGMIPDPGTGAHIYAGHAHEQLGHLINSPHLGRHANDRHFHHIQNLLKHLHHLMAQSEQLQWEKRLWHEKSNVVLTVPWVALNPNTVSSTATTKAPYSGVNYMVLDLLTVAELTPPGLWTNINFAGINFADPGLKQVAYDTGAGAQGTPSATQRGMGFSVHYTNKTSPDGSRGWQPWTGWILSAAAEISFNWVNLDQNNPRSLILDVLMRSSPCGAFEMTNMPQAWHVSEGYHQAVNQIYGVVRGLSGLKSGPPTPDGAWGPHANAWTNGQAMNSFPSGRMGPSGHRAP